MSILAFLNRLLPFATPGTPVIQDVLHLAAICALLYFAPQIQERLQTTQERNTETAQQNEEPAQVQGLHEPEQAPEHDAPQHEIHNHDDQREAGHQPGRDDAFDGAAGNHNNHIEEGQAGPARAPMIPEQRNVGAKKAKALARRDQRRAYHEFQRSQGEAQRARDAEGAEERGKAQAAERERRKLAEVALEAKKAREREKKRAKEEAERALKQQRREQAIELVRSRLEADRMCDLFRVAREVGVDDEEWVERILRASGLIGRRDDSMTMVTDVGWAVRVTAADMQRVYMELLDSSSAPGDGQSTPEHVASVLQRSLAPESHG